MIQSKNSMPIRDVQEKHLGEWVTVEGCGPKDKHADTYTGVLRGLKHWNNGLTTFIFASGTRVTAVSSSRAIVGR